MFPSQQTEDGTQALRRSVDGGDELLVPAHVAVEFGSLLRKTVTRGSLRPHRVEELMRTVDEVTAAIVWNDAAVRRGLNLANRLGHSDTFDATGYALAELLDAEFWCCDKRFANAAEALGLERVRLFR